MKDGGRPSASRSSSPEIEFLPHLHRIHLDVGEVIVGGVVFGLDRQGQRFDGSHMQVGQRYACTRASSARARCSLYSSIQEKCRPVRSVAHLPSRVFAKRMEGEAIAAAECVDRHRSPKCVPLQILGPDFVC